MYGYTEQAVACHMWYFYLPALRAFYLSVNSSSFRDTEKGIFLQKKIHVIYIFVPSGTMGGHLKAMKCFMRPNGICNQI